MRKFHKILLISLSSIIFILAGLFILFYRTSFPEYLLKRKSEPIIEVIDKYKEKNHVYPKKLSDTGLPEPGDSGPIFYELKDSSMYEVWFEPYAGESTTYNSKTKTWYP